MLSRDSVVLEPIVERSSSFGEIKRNEFFLKRK